MKKLYSTLAIFAISASGAFAAEGDTWLLNAYATETKDSIETNAMYGYQTFQNEASAVTVNVSGGSVNLVASKLASDGTEGYTANIGLLHPLTPDWAEYDLTGLTKITFDYMNDTKITDVLSVSFGSSAYSEAISNAGTVYSNDIAGSAALNGGTTWKQGEVLIEDFATPSWWKDIPDDFPTIDEVLKKVKNLQFAPKTLYSASGSQAGTACTKCVTPTMTSVTLKIKNVVLHGVKASSWPNPLNEGCEDTKPFVQFSEFESGSKNYFAGYFFSFSDTAGLDSDPAKGSSFVTDSIYEDGYMVMSAKLNKKAGGKYNKYSGWANIGTDFAGKASLNATGLTGISFLLADLGTNATYVQDIIFKAKMKGGSDTALHQVKLPMADIIAGGNAGKVACIRPTDLVQAAYVQASHRKDFDPKAIEQFAWEAKITDDRSPAIDTATVELLLANVVLHGSADFVLNKDGTGIKSQMRVKTSVSYANGALQLSGFVGANRFEVRDLSGKVVASFDATKRVSLALPRGTYLLSATGDKVSYSNKFAVLDR
jgi:hypothetical protein